MRSPGNLISDVAAKELEWVGKDASSVDTPEYAMYVESVRRIQVWTLEALAEEASDPIMERLFCDLAVGIQLVDDHTLWNRKDVMNLPTPQQFCDRGLFRIGPNGDIEAMLDERIYATRPYGDAAIEIVDPTTDEVVAVLTMIEDGDKPRFIPLAELRKNDADS